MDQSDLLKLFHIALKGVGAEQKDVIRQIRSGCFQVVVATNAAKDNLELAMCDLVIQMDPMSSVAAIEQIRSGILQRQARSLSISRNDEQARKIDDLLKREENMKISARLINGVWRNRYFTLSPPSNQNWQIDILRIIKNITAPKKPLFNSFPKNGCTVSFHPWMKTVRTKYCGSVTQGSLQVKGLKIDVKQRGQNNEEQK